MAHRSFKISISSSRMPWERRSTASMVVSIDSTARANRHVPIVALASPDGRDVTIVGLNHIEEDTPVNIPLAGTDIASATPFILVHTPRAGGAAAGGAVRRDGNVIRLTVPEGRSLACQLLP